MKIVVVGSLGRERDYVFNSIVGQFKQRPVLMKGLDLNIEPELVSMGFKDWKSFYFCKDVNKILSVVDSLYYTFSKKEFNFGDMFVSNGSVLHIWAAVNTVFNDMGYYRQCDYSMIARLEVFKEILYDYVESVYDMVILVRQIDSVDTDFYGVHTVPAGRSFCYSLERFLLSCESDFSFIDLVNRESVKEFVSTFMKNVISG